MYINQQIQVKWNNAISKQSNILVKQGGCLSPSLFSVYLNKLIEIFGTSNVGCRYSQCMGVYYYADDLSLLSTSFTGLQEMLRYAIDHNIIFNAIMVRRPAAKRLPSSSSYRVIKPSSSISQRILFLYH